MITKKSYLAFVLLLLFFINCYGENSGRPRTGLALCGGSALGFAHIGVLKVIDSLDIPIDYLAGTSMGGIVGGLYSIGYSAEELERLALSVEWNELFTDKPARFLLPYFEKKNTGRFQLELQLKGFTPTIPSGLIQGQKVNLLLSKLTGFRSETGDFDNLRIPFRCIAADLITGNEVVLEKGSLTKALRATMSIPTVFSPVIYGDSLLIDGGVINNFPTDVVKSMGADIIIGCNLIYPKRSSQDYESLLEILDRTTEIPRKARRERNIRLSDIYIPEDIEGYTLMDFDKEKIQGIINRGYEAAIKNIDKLIALKQLLDETGSEDHNSRFRIGQIFFYGSTKYTENELLELTGLNSDSLCSKKFVENKIQSLTDSGLYQEKAIKYQYNDDETVDINIFLRETNRPPIHGISIRGNKTLDFRFIYNLLGIKPGSTFNPSLLEEKINDIYSLGYFETMYYDLTRIPGKGVHININVQERSLQKMYAGMKYNDHDMIIGLLGIQTNSLFIPGLRTELELQFAGLHRFSLNIAYPSRSLNLPIYPYVKIVNKNIPVDIYNGMGKNIAQYKDRSWLFGAGIGIPISTYGTIETEYTTEFMDVSASIASDDFPQWKDQLTQIRVKAISDLVDSKLIPRKGILLKGVAEIGSKRIGSEIGYSTVDLSSDIYFTIESVHTFHVGGRYMVSFRNLPQYKYFNLGGPESFAGINYQQLSGSKFTILSGEYRYEHRKDIFLKALFNIAFDYKLGFSGFSTVGKPILGYGIAVEFDSILGPIQFMLSEGDKKMGKPGEKTIHYYFTAGYKF